MYSLHQFGYMIIDQVRMNAYVETLRHVLRPGDVVVDIGAGTGVFSLIACQMGASRVYAIEANPLIELGPKMAAANGFSDRIVFIHDLSTKVSLPEKADVIIADLRGQLPLYGENVRSMADARKRLLKPGGHIIPHRDKIYATLLASPETYRNHIKEPWLENPYQLDMSSALSLLVHLNIQEREMPVTILLPPQVWATIDYTTREDPNVSATLEWDVDTPGKADFVGMWFDAEFMNGVGYSNAPNSESASIYGRAMLPLERPIDLEPGDHVTLTIKANLVGGSYQYTWLTRIVSGEKIKANFQQSTFFANLFSDIRKRSAGYVPQLNTKGRITQFILNGLQESIPLKEIAVRLQAEFPQQFPDVDEALAMVGSLSATFSK